MSQEAGVEFQGQFVTACGKGLPRFASCHPTLQRQDSQSRHDLGQTVQPKVSISQHVIWDEYLQLWGIIVGVKYDNAIPVKELRRAPRKC